MLGRSKFFFRTSRLLSWKTWNSWTRSPRSQRKSSLLQVTQSIPVRFVAISASLHEPVDVSRWLRIQPIPKSCLNHRYDRSIPSCEPISLERVIIFVPSRSQCRSIVNDLVTQSVIEYTGLSWEQYSD